MTTIGTTAATGMSALSPAASPGPPAPTLVGDSARIAIAVALSRVTGLLRIVVAASILGATVLGDLFVAINILPLTLYDVFAGSAISSVLVPPLVRLLGCDDRARARRLAGSAVGVIGVLMAAVTLVAVLGRSLLAGALTAGVDGALAGDARAVASLLVLLIVPQIVVYAAIGVMVSVQHANHRFLLPSVAPVVENVGLLVTIAVAWWRYGSGIEVDRAPTGLVLTLAVGSGLSVLAHAAVQLVGAVRAIGPFVPRFGWRDPDLRALFEPARASLGWSGTLAARQFALIVAAAYAGAGGVQAFEIAILVYYIPLALVGRPIASAALPRLAGASDRPDRLLAAYRDSLRLALWPAAAAGLAMVVLARPLAEAVGHGRFDGPESTRLLVYGLVGLGAGALGEALFEIGRQTTMAIGSGGAATRRRGLVASTWLRIGVALIGLPAVVVLVDGPAVLLGLGLVVSIGDLIALAVVHRALRANPAWEDDGIRHRHRVALAATIVLGPAALLDRLVEPDWHPVQLVALMAATVVAYGGTAWLVTGRGRLLADLATRLRHREETP